MSEDNLKRIHEIATKCHVEFSTEIIHCVDGSHEYYRFDYHQFLKLDEVRKYAEHFLDKWDLNQIIKAYQEVISEKDDEITELKAKFKGEQERYENNITTCNKVIDIHGQTIEELTYKTELSAKLLDMSMTKEAADLKTIRSLRAQLGHAKKNQSVIFKKVAKK